jgi:predicted lipid-binding transport protein (Tim44 family)
VERTSHGSNPEIRDIVAAQVQVREADQKQKSSTVTLDIEFQTEKISDIEF